MKEKIVVVRKWSEPEVTAFISESSVGASMSVENYLESLVSQITNLPFTVTKAALLAKLIEAHSSVLVEMKNTTKYVV
jgi:hypothetical protein